MIVGSSLACLATAVYCADAGYRVLLLDEHTEPSRETNRISSNDIRTDALIKRFGVMSHYMRDSSFTRAQIIHSLLLRMKSHRTKHYDSSFENFCKRYLRMDISNFLAIDPYFVCLFKLNVSQALQLLQKYIDGHMCFYVNDLNYLLQTKMRKWLAHHSKVTILNPPDNKLLQWERRHGHIISHIHRGCNEAHKVIAYAVVSAFGITKLNDSSASSIPCVSQQSSTTSSRKNDQELHKMVLMNTNIVFPWKVPSMATFEIAKDRASHYQPYGENVPWFDVGDVSKATVEQQLCTIDDILPHMFEHINMHRNKHDQRKTKQGSSNETNKTVSWAQLDDLKRHQIEWCMIRDPLDDTLKVIDMAKWQDVLGDNNNNACYRYQNITHLLSDSDMIPLDIHSKIQHSTLGIICDS